MRDRSCYTPQPAQVLVDIYIIYLSWIEKLPGILHIDTVTDKELKAIPVDMVVLDHLLKNVERFADGFGFLVGAVRGRQRLENIGNRQDAFGNTQFIT